MANMNTTLLIESLDLSEAQFNPDTRTLSNVGLIKAGKSLNRRFYSEAVLQNAVKVFEGSKAFDSHAKGERRVGELTGWYENVRFEDGVLRADRHFLPTNAGKDVMAVVEAIVSQKAPRNLAGLSINAVGSGKVQKLDGEDYLHVESITAANSVDDVVNPAAGGSYIESANGDEMAAALLNSMTFEEFFEARPEYIKRIQNEMKTIRQDDALKAVKTEAESAQRMLTEAQAQIETLTGERDAALVEAQSKARALAVVDILSKVTLPKSFKDDLREELVKLPESEWQSKIEREQAKVKAANVQPRIAVTGGGQAIHAVESVRVPEPRRINWAEIDTPEAQKAILEARK